MADVASTVDKIAVIEEAKRQHRIAKGSFPEGGHLIHSSKDIVPTSSNTVGDLINLIEYPDNCYLRGVSVSSDAEWDTGGTALKLDLVLSDGATSTTTSAVGSAFTNQPANDGVTIVSASGADTGTVTIIGTTQGTDTVVVEDLALTGATPANSVKTDWGVILAVSLPAVPAGTVTIKETSGGATITTLTTSIASRGYNAVASDQQAYYNRLVNIVASGSTTKQVGLIGLDEDGTTIYDSQALTGATEVQSNTKFQTVTYVLTGDVEATRTVTIESGEQVLVSASTAFTGLPTPINFNSAAIAGSPFAVDCSEQTLALRVNTAATTANSALTLTVLSDIVLSKGEPVVLS